MDGRNLLSKELLNELYCNQKKNMREVGAELSVSASTVYEYLKKFDIMRRQRGERIDNPTLEQRLPKDELKSLYYIQGKSLNEIGEMYGVGCSTVRHLMDRYELKRRPPIRQSKFKELIDGKTLKQLYWEQGNSTREIGKILCISQPSVRRLMLDSGIEARKSNEALKRPLQQRLSKEMLKNLYIDLRKSSIEISKITGERSESIVTLLKRYNINARSYSESNHIRFSRVERVNTSFFKKESRELFYILGLLLTDGYLTGNDIIGLGLTDRDVIDWVSATIGYKNEIHIESLDKCYAMGKLVENPKPTYKLKFQSKEVADVLRKYCMVPRKSLILECPSVPDIYISDFIRGIMDGDGWVMANHFKRSDGVMVTRARIGIGSASEKFIVGVKALIEKLIGGDRKVYCDKSQRMFRYIVTRKEDVIFLVEKLYADNAFGMSRKMMKIVPVSRERTIEKYVIPPRSRDKSGRFCK